jgi:hypothetical protein
MEGQEHQRDVFSGTQREASIAFGPEPEWCAFSLARFVLKAYQGALQELLMADRLIRSKLSWFRVPVDSIPRMPEPTILLTTAVLQFEVGPSGTLFGNERLGL